MLNKKLPVTFFFFDVIFIFASQYCLFFAEVVHGRQHIRTP
jgi:hypothetical protein